MLTWETLTKHIENGCMDDDLRLIAQLLIDLEFHCHTGNAEGIFGIVRNQAMTNSIEYFQQHFPRSV